MYTVDLYRRVRLACHHDGLSQREASRRFGISRQTVKKMLAHSIPPGQPDRDVPQLMPAALFFSLHSHEDRHIPAKCLFRVMTGRLSGAEMARRLLYM